MPASLTVRELSQSQPEEEICDELETAKHRPADRGVGRDPDGRRKGNRSKARQQRREAAHQGDGHAGESLLQVSWDGRAVAETAWQDDPPYGRSRHQGGF